MSPKPSPAERRPHLAILGAGPTGLEAALAAAEQGYPFTLYEAGEAVADHIRGWGHVRLFSPWDLDASPRARARLAREGRQVPTGAGCPTGAELVAELLAPLAELPEIAPHLALGSRVVAVGRQGLLKHEEIGSAERGRRRFRLLIQGGDGRERIEQADGVLDCTGSYGHPNPLGDGGIPAPGERALETAAGPDGAPRIVRRIPDLEREGERWAGREILLVGAGHSAQTAARDLAALAASHPGTRVVWALRGEGLGRVEDDPLPERARLAALVAALLEGASPAMEVRTGVVVEALGREGGRVRVVLRHREGSTEVVTVDRILALTGAVGDHGLYRQLQVHECYATSGPMKLAAALLGEAGGGGDCLAQQSFGADTLKNPEPGFFILGAKSYGRNNTFLMRVGWQQVEEVFELLASLRLPGSSPAAVCPDVSRAHSRGV